MKKLLLSSIVACSLFASEQNFIEIGGGFVKEKDNFSTNSNNKITSYTTAKSQDETIPNISFLYSTDINKNANIYFGSEFGSLYLGSEIEINIGYFDIGLLSNTQGKAWENPFLLNSNRKKTDIKEVGGYIGYGIPLSESYFASLVYEYSKIDFDKDVVVTDLKRDGKKYVVSLENAFEFNEKFALIITPKYENYSAKGKASSYDTVSIEAIIEYKFNKNFELTINNSIV